MTIFLAGTARAPRAASDALVADMAERAKTRPATGRKPQAIPAHAAAFSEFNVSRSKLEA
jgi:hypothetical protein